MNEKELNLQVLAKLVEIAKEIFAKVTVSKEGTYTAAELWNGKNSLGEVIVINYNGTENEIYADEVEGFKFQVSPRDIFLRLWKFERLCNVKQENKCRFTFGESEGEAISEKAMYKSNKGEIITRKKNMVKVCDNIAYSIEKGKTNPINLYFLTGGLWYMVGDAPDKETMKGRVKLLKQKDFILNNLKRRTGLMSEECTLSPIFKALYEVLCTEAIKDTPEERKCENKPENTVIREVVMESTKCGSIHVEQMEVKEVGNGLYKDANNLYFEHERRLYILGGYTRGTATFIKHQIDIKAKIVSMIEAGGICTESAKILYEKITAHTLGKPAKVEPAPEETHEDYPPEPYNRTGEASCNDEAVNVSERKAIRTTFARQKVFPNELHFARRKIRRFKRISFARYTNYHSRGESAANQTGSGKSGGY